ncbi:MAG: TRAP transporter large permease [Oscillospiraceae bacterium]|nr:TRAP transporter large permease [Oscillospiraceae bacterium]
MSPVTIGVLGLAIFLLLMFLGLPIPFSMLFVGVAGLAILKTPAAAAQIMVGEITTQFSSYAITVAPLFGLMGFLAYYTGIGSNLFRVIDKFLGHWRGGLAIATEVACAGFGAICGSAPATIGTMCAVAYPEMRKNDYSPTIAGPAIASGANLAALIPPSTTFIIYGLACDTSIGGLFIAGIVPGVLLTLCFAVLIWVMAKRHPELAPPSPKASWAERWEALKHGSVIEVAIIFLLSMGGMFTGLFTPTEAGAIGAFGTLVITLVSRKLDFKRFLAALSASVRLQAMVFVLMACATVFSRFLAVSTIPTQIGNGVRTMLENGVPQLAILLVIILIYFIMGMFTDLISMTLLTIPIFHPIVCDVMGYSTYWFGVLIVLLVAIGNITPPVGGGIFMVKGCVPWDKEATISKMFAGVWYFVIALFISVVLIIACPQLVTFLVDLM